MLFVTTRNLIKSASFIMRKYNDTDEFGEKTRIVQ